MKDYVEIIVGFWTIVAAYSLFVWRLAQVKAQIDRSIENNRRQINDEVASLRHRFDLHAAEYIGKKDLIDFRLHGHDELITRKFDACWAEIRQLQNFLTKDGFVPRDSNKEVE